MPMHRQTALLQRLGLALPIVQAPMAGVSSPALAAAVSNAGGLGSIAIGASRHDAAREMIQGTRAATPKPFNVNVFCHAPAVQDPQREAAWCARLAPLFARFDARPPETLTEIYRSFIADPDMLALLLAEKPAVVSFHFGLPAQATIDALRTAGIVLLATATSLPEAQRIAAAGCDAIVAQGIEAGGHRGVFDPAAPDAALPTLDLIRQLAGSVPLPVIAAGGLMTGADIRTALDAGAVAAQLGTAFIACPESLADAPYRAALTGAPGHATKLTRAISGRPARCLGNSFAIWGETVPIEDIPDYPIAYDAGKALNAAAKARGEHSFAPQWSGTGAPKARALPAADLIATLAAELTTA